MESISVLRRRMGAHIQIWLGLLFGSGALYLALRGLDFRQVGQVLGNVRLPYVALTLLAYLLTSLVKALRWRYLFLPQRPSLGLGRLASLLVVGQAVNLLLPTRLGELVRAYLTGEEAGTSKAYTLGTIAAEKFLDLVALALLILGLLPFIALPDWLSARVGPVVLTAVVLMSGIALLLAGRRLWVRLSEWFFGVLPVPWAAQWNKRIVSGLDGLGGLAHPSAVLAVWAWTLVAWVLAAVTNLLLFLAFDLPPSALAALFLLAVLQAGVAVPSAPGKIGVFHYLCVLALGVFDVPAPVALSYGLVLHFIILASSSTWAAIALWGRSWSLRRLAAASGSWQ